MQGFFWSKEISDPHSLCVCDLCLSFWVRKGVRLLSFSVKVSKTDSCSINEKFSYWSDLFSTAIDFCSLFCHLDLKPSITYWLRDRKSIICILRRPWENGTYLYIHWCFITKFWACNKAVSRYSGFEKFMVIKDNFQHN